ncbi:CIA30 family protein [uncultured Polaribacter sp.]|uniref:CIA30 family protein n=1 Tax=uncultured Polaribacter sp. TaxID=174711 RepID=UPI002603E349|nr:CIA30 family protein [uncultured Polaribacter sp.]
MKDTNKTIFKFSDNQTTLNWKVINDTVMGGVSFGGIKINANNNGEFYGNVSIENNGGFSLLRYRFNKKNVSNYTKIILRIRADGKKYQFRIKDNISNNYSFVKIFSSGFNWELIKITLSEMEPVFRGRKLEMPNFSSEVIEEIAILIGNKKNESFKLEIDKIYLQ